MLVVLHSTATSLFFIRTDDTALRLSHHLFFRDYSLEPLNISPTVHANIIGDMPKNPSSQYGLKAQEDINPRGIMITNGPMR